MRIKKSQLEALIKEAVRIGTGDRSEIYDNPDPTDDDMALRFMDRTPYSVDDSDDIMDRGDREEEDVEELARYHALNGDRDETLYRDNPDYRDAYDDMTMSEGKKIRATKNQLRAIIRETISQSMSRGINTSDAKDVYYRDTIVLGPEGDSFIVNGNETYLQDVPLELEVASGGFGLPEDFARRLKIFLRRQMEQGYAEITVQYKNGQWSMI